jgi:hypothetical protein
MAHYFGTQARRAAAVGGHRSGQPGEAAARPGAQNHQRRALADPVGSAVPSLRDGSLMDTTVS